jgi:glucose-1-phosphate adenylyltransferase
MVFEVVAVILGGGRGSRLFPLTYGRSKPAVPVGGKYRLVDIPISNCLNSGIDRIFLLTQFNSSSLNRHVSTTYRFDNFTKGFVEILPAEQTEVSTEWYQGTADAVRKQFYRIASTGAEDVVILSGDHLYRMDIWRFLDRHRQANADITVAATYVKREEVADFGIMKIDRDGMINAFAEKPKDSRVIDDFAISEPIGDKTHLASMGIYIFKTEVLRDMLSTEEGSDFGHDLIPAATVGRRVVCFKFDGYWADLGTIRAYHKANLELAEVLPRYNFFVPDNPVYTRPRFLPASKINRATVESTLLAEGCLVEEGVKLRHCVLGIRSFLRRGTTLINTICQGASTYQNNPVGGVPSLGIGEDCLIKSAIIDREARIGRGARLTNRLNFENFDGDHLYVRDGIIIVPRNGVIPQGYVF